MPKGPDRFETARLVLLKPRAVDAKAIFERYASDPDVTRLLGWSRHRSIADTDAFLRFCAEAWQRWPAGPYLMRSRETDELLGSTGFEFHKPRHAWTGYVLAKDAWSKGYATEALRAIVDLAPGLGVTQLSALCHPSHSASQRVLEKCGFVRDELGTRQMEYPNLAPGVRQDALRFNLDLRAIPNHTR
jgi:RimJ/RimL family protein N-acetyltransferase